MTTVLSRRRVQNIFGMALLLTGSAVIIVPANVVAQTRHDIIGEVANGGVGQMIVNEFPLGVDVVGGSLSLQADDLRCVARQNHPCTFVLGELVVQFSNFRYSGHDIGNATLNVHGPVAVKDWGQGIVIPEGTPGQLTYWLDGEPSDTVGQMSTAAVMQVNHGKQFLTIIGSFEGSSSGVTVVATMAARLKTPFINVPPRAEAGADVTAGCGLPSHLDGSGSTDANNDIVQYRWSENGSTIAVGALADVSLPVGDHQITLTVTDSHGGRGIDTLVVHVVPDTTPPTFDTKPGDRTVSVCSAPPIGAPTVSDNCGGPITLVSDAPAVFPLGVTTVTWTATDKVGNSDKYYQQVTVTGQPTFTSVPTNLSYTACEKPPTSIGSATAVDICGTPVSVTNNAPASFPFGTTTVTWTATDAIGNIRTHPQTVSVTAIDLGPEHKVSSVGNNACLRITQYPSWAPYMHTIIVQPQASGVGWPIPFTFTNCSNSGGSVMPGPWQQGTAHPINTTCPTHIKLGGNGAGPVSLTWWGNG